MGNIRVLNQHLTNMISAGEVVERPSGIIKELIENSLDAKASEIEITIKDGGISYIQVKDNGIGMDSADATLAFERHATSKLKSEADLFAIKTMGFRGEALPSIASVSEVELITNNKEESTKVRIEYGKLIEAKPFYGEEGTQITIENLFLKTPARLKHLKTRQYEAALVSSIVEKYALGHPEIAFTLVSDGKELLNFKGNNDIVEVMSEIYGTQTARNTVNFAGSDYDFKVSGTYVLPNITRASNNYITLFINHRLIRNYRLQKVIMEAFSDYLFNDRYPIVLLNIESDAQLVDVNVHPTKWEIRLSKSAQLEDLIRNTLMTSLQKQMQAPEISQIKAVYQPKVEFSSFDLDAITSIREEKVEENKTVSFISSKSEPKTEDTENYVKKKPFPIMSVIGQLHGKYILCEAENGLYIIDQHAAMERCNYEKFRNMLTEDETPYQQLLIPHVSQVNKGILENFTDLQKMFKDLQLDIELFGSDSIICRQIPLWMKDIDLTVYFQDLLDYFQLDQKPSLLTLRDKALESLACHASVKFNTYLTLEEMKEVLNNLQNCTNPFKCPHGRPTFMLVSSEQLEKEFLR